MNVEWLAIMALVYITPAILVLFILYKGYRYVTRGRSMAFTGIPKLTTVTTKNLPKQAVTQLEAINDKAQKLLGYYNNNQIKDAAVVGENQFLVKKILNDDLPEAIADYQRLDNTRANQMAVGSTGKTAYQLLMDYLTTINEQFDTMLDAMYEQNAQKLLVSNRYLQARFNQSDTHFALLVDNTQPSANNLHGNLTGTNLDGSIAVPAPAIPKADSQVTSNTKQPNG